MTEELIQWLLAGDVSIQYQTRRDGGFNCESNQHGAVHSSLHTSLSVIEGILQNARSGYSYRLGELEKDAAEACEFILQHRLFLSDHSGQVIRPDFLKLSFPPQVEIQYTACSGLFQNGRSFVGSVDETCGGGSAQKARGRRQLAAAGRSSRPGPLRTGARPVRRAAGTPSWPCGCCVSTGEHHQVSEYLKEGISVTIC